MKSPTHFKNFVGVIPRFTLNQVLFILAIIITVVVQSVVIHAFVAEDTFWDVTTIARIAENYVNYGTTEFDGGEHITNYLNVYPNNKLLTAILSFVYVIAMSVGEVMMPTLPMVVCLLLATMSVGLIIYSAFILGGKKAAIPAFILSLLLVSANHHISEFYSDLWGLFIISLLAYLIIRLVVHERVKHVNIYLAAIGCLTTIGYFIKPTVILISLSGLVVLIIKYFKNRKKKTEKASAKKWIINSSAVMGGLILTYATINLVYCAMPNFARFDTYQQNKQQTGVTSYFAMGSLRGLEPFPECSNGAFCVRFWQEVYGIWGTQIPELADKSTRTKYEIQLIKDSVKTDFPIGYLGFISNKLSSNFLDVTTFSVLEGGVGRIYYNHESFDQKVRNTLSFRNQGFTYGMSLIWTFWMATLLLCVLSLTFLWLGKKRSNRFVICWLVLSIIMLIAYGTLSEFRTRYIWHFLPVFIILASYGLSLINFKTMKLLFDRKKTVIKLGSDG